MNLFVVIFIFKIPVISCCFQMFIFLCLTFHYMIPSRSIHINVTNCDINSFSGWVIFYFYIHYIFYLICCGCLSCFHFLAIVNNALYIGIICKLAFENLWDVAARVELLSHMVVLVRFWTRLFSMFGYQFTSHQQCTKVSLFSFLTFVTLWSFWW